MKNTNTYLYFGGDGGSDSSLGSLGDSGMYPAANFTGIDPISATTTRISFKALTGEAADDDILLTHVTGKFKEVCEALALALSSEREQGMITFAAMAQVGIGSTEPIYFNKLRELGCIDGSSAVVITMDTQN